MLDYEEWIKKQESDFDYENYHIKKNGVAGYIPKESFFIDGIICDKEYESACKKVLYIAKECNAWEYDKPNVVNKENRLNMSEFFARKELKKGDKTKNRFLKGMAMLHNAILTDNYSKPDKNNVESLSSAAMINLNKRGGYSWCIWDTLEGYVKKYQNYLREQIKQIHPNVIVCCGESVEYLVKEYNLAEGYDDDHIKCAYHPSCFSVSDYNKLQFLKTQEKKAKADNAKPATADAEKSDAVYGVILDTNNRWAGQGTQNDMLSKKQARTYGNARESINRIKKGSHVLFYSSGKGIVAIGKATSSYGHDDKNDAEWREVIPVVPGDFQDAITNPNYVSPKEVKEIVKEQQSKGFWWTGTIKNIVLTQKSVDEIIERLRENYKGK